MKKKSNLLLTLGALGVLSTPVGVIEIFPNDFKSPIAYAATSREVTVYPSDFLNYFQQNGSAANFPYDTNNFIQTLTPDQRAQAGNVTLKTKVDMSQNFSFTGLVNLGDKSMRRGGADGIGFLFHPGDTNIVGAPGGAAGIGGVNGAFGFKLDTYFNNWNDTAFAADPQKFSPNQSFGAFVNGLDGQAKAIAESAQNIPQPSNNNFVTFSITYNGSNKIMTVTYGGQTWSQDVSSLIGDEKAMSFSIAASTGANTNLQQLKNVQFSYTIAQGEVTANYLDESGNSISDSVIMNGDLNTNYETTQKEIPGYTLKEVTGAQKKGLYIANDQIVNYIYIANKGAMKVTYIDDTTGQVLTNKEFTGVVGQSVDYNTTDDIAYYKNQGFDLVSDNYPQNGAIFEDNLQEYVVHLIHSNYKEIEKREINETIHYLYEDGNIAAPEYNATPLVFSREVITDKVNGNKTFGGWKAENGNQFGEVKSPSINGYTPDQEIINKIEDISFDTTDINKTVYYKRNQGTVKVKFFDDTTGKELNIHEFSGGTNEPVNYTTEDEINSYKKSGYNLVSDSYPTTGAEFSDVEQYFEIHLTHIIDTVVEEKSVKQTIHYVYEDGSKATKDFIAEPILFNRTIKIDRVTGEKLTSEWKPVKGESFDSVISPNIHGYRPDKLIIPEVENITAETADIEETVIYSQLPPGVIIPPIVTPPAVIIPPVTPPTGTLPPSTPSENTDRNIEKKLKNEEQTKKSDKTNVNELPSTGDSQKVQKTLSAFGIVLLLISTIILTSRRRKQ